MESKFFEIFVEAIRSNKDKYRSVERWKEHSKIADLGIYILSETTRKSIMKVRSIEKKNSK
ncbi:MAG: hypothetical protein B6U76_01410 [Desulfurococcales archaeon ex4484_217_2]|nr:MAG: hypothetical protein B6U76_01410 [Desulfurococcales archaeon ex4484_217_2]